MKKLLYIINEGLRKFTYERTAGLVKAIEHADEPINLYIVRSDGYTGFSLAHNQGESNIFRLPDYAAFDGILLDFNSNFNAGTNSGGASGAQHCIRAAAASGKPVISIANHMDGFYYVGIDNYAAMTEVIRHLHREMGLTDFWFAMGPEDNYENRIRTQALRDYCQENDLPCGYDRFHAESFLLESGMHAFKRMYRLHGQRLPQAVICANDSIAVGVCRAAEAKGLNVPRDFLVTGFDNLDISAYLTPSVTTVDQLCWTMGDACIDILQRLWRGESVPRANYTPTRLVLRESTGYPKPQMADAAQDIVKYISRDMRTTEFTYRLSAMQYQLPWCESIEDICRALTRCVSSLNCKGLFLVLDSELYEYGSDFELGESADGLREASHRLCTEGYPESMKLVYAWQSGKAPEFPMRKVRGMLPALEDLGTRENILFLPLHFMEQTVGYLAVWDCVEMMYLKCLSGIINTLTMALHSYYSRNRLTHANRVLSGLSMTDDLTGLYNRLGYHRLVPRMFKEAHDSGKQLGVIFIDMDRMKYFNDRFGHAYGDLAIQCVSRAIRRDDTEDAVAVRYGGDEFLVVAPVESVADVRRRIAAIHRAIPGEAEALGMPETPGISTGFVLTDPRDARSLGDYVDEADRLMYENKKLRKAWQAE